MAINGAVENEFGIDFEYHKLREVRRINDDKIGVQLTLTVYSWANKQARIAGKKASVRQCIISGADFALTPFYAMLKAKFPDFTAGENDFDNDFKGNLPPQVPEFFEQTGQGGMFRRWTEQVQETPAELEELEPEEPEQNEDISEQTAENPEQTQTDEISEINEEQGE